MLFFAVSALSILDPDGSRAQFRYLGYPEFLALPLSVAEVLGMAAILSRRSRALMDLAFAGFLFELLLAAAGHLVNGDVDVWLTALGLLLWTAAFAADRRRFPRRGGFVRSVTSPEVTKLYWASNGFLCLVFSGSVVLTVFDPVTTFQQTEGLGYPVYTSIPLVILKILGLMAIVSRRSRILADLAYAGFLFDLLLAASAHFANGEVYGLFATSCSLIWVAAYWSHNARYPDPVRAPAPGSLAESTAESAALVQPR